MLSNIWCGVGSVRGRLELGLDSWERLSLSNAQRIPFQFHADFVFSSSSSNDPHWFILRVLIHSVSSILWFLFVVSISSLVARGRGRERLKKNYRGSLYKRFRF